MHCGFTRSGERQGPKFLAEERGNCFRGDRFGQELDLVISHVIHEEQLLGEEAGVERIAELSLCDANDIDEGGVSP
jgi:hypothetical protein